MARKKSFSVNHEKKVFDTLFKLLESIIKNYVLAFRKWAPMELLQ